MCSSPDRYEPPASAALMRALAAHPELMADLIVALNIRASDAEALLDLMGRVARQAVNLVPDVHWAGVTAQFDGQDPFTLAHTDAKVLIVDERQYAVNDGPCLTAMRTGRAVRMSLDEVTAQWPELGEQAEQVGVRSFLALPLHLRGRAVGSLNLYSAHLGALRTADPDVLVVLTEYLSRGFTDYANQRSEPLGGTLRVVLARQAVIEQAVGVLMIRYDEDPDQARARLTRQADGVRQDLAGYAQQLLDGRPPSAD